MGKVSQITRITQMPSGWKSNNVPPEWHLCNPCNL